MFSNLARKIPQLPYPTPIPFPALFTSQSTKVRHVTTPTSATLYSASSSPAGVAALFKGLTPMALRYTPGGGILLVAFDFMNRALSQWV
jgi:hypothetical protein